jgi:hypothetical protein
MKKNMAQIFIFIYAFLTFLSLFLVVANTRMSFFKPFLTLSYTQSYITFFINKKILYHFSVTLILVLLDIAVIPCVTNDDCPEAIPPKYYKCMFKYCVLIK